MKEQTNNWPELAIGLYDKLTGRNATINYNFENLEIDVPSGVDSKDFAHWKVNGKVSISTSEDKS